MTTIKNVALVGASGSLGVPVLKALIDSTKFNITILKRPSSAATFPDSVTVKTADLSSLDAVTAVLKGQDAVVSTVGSAAVLSQSVLIEAAVAAGVKRFLPSDFGCDLANPKANALPVYKNKIVIHKQIKEAAAANPDFTYTLVCNNAFLDWGFQNGFLLNWKDSKPKLYDGGEKKFSVTTLASVGQAVVGVLSHPEETKNRFVYVKDIDVSQLQLLDVVKRIDPDRKWDEPTYLDTAEIEKASNESLARGQVSSLVLSSYLTRVLFGPSGYGGQFAGVDNELLGVKGKTQADVEAVLKPFLKG